MFRRNILLPSPGLRSKPRKKRAERGSKQYSKLRNKPRKKPAEADRKLQKKDIYFRNVGISPNYNTWRYIPEYCSLHSHRSEVLKLKIHHSEDTRDVATSPPPPEETGSTLELKYSGGTRRSLKSLKPSVVLLPLYNKLTVTLIVPSPGACSSCGTDSHIHGCLQRGSN
jgi:hypothetical protein